MSNRLLNPSLIPETLWESQGQILVLPIEIATAYLQILDRRGLTGLANSRDPNDPPVGGLSQADSDKHFAQAFDGSAARAQLALLDPHSHLPNVSDTFINALAGNYVCVIDAPCGAGAATYAFLTVIASLRASGVLPRVPLDIALVAADLSDPARQFANEVHDHLIPGLAEQAIFITPEFCSWDVTDRLSNTSLIQRFLKKCSDNDRRLLLVANFNGFLEKERKRKAAEPQLEELFRYCSGANCRALWIEPRMNHVTKSGGLFDWVVSKINSLWHGFMSLFVVSDEGSLGHASSSARFREPLSPEITPRVQVAVLPINLERQL